jgi:hypothetical protein
MPGVDLQRIILWVLTKGVEVLVGAFTFQGTNELQAPGKQRLQVSLNVSECLDITKHQCNAEKLGFCTVHFRSEMSGLFATQSRTWMKTDTENFPHWSDSFYVRRHGGRSVDIVRLRNKATEFRRRSYRYFYQLHLNSRGCIKITPS